MRGIQLPLLVVAHIIALQVAICHHVPLVFACIIAMDLGMGDHVPWEVVVHITMMYSSIRHHVPLLAIAHVTTVQLGMCGQVPLVVASTITAVMQLGVCDQVPLVVVSTITAMMQLGVCDKVPLLIISCITMMQLGVRVKVPLLVISYITVMQLGVCNPDVPRRCSDYVSMSNGRWVWSQPAGIPAAHSLPCWARATPVWWLPANKNKEPFYYHQTFNIMHTKSQNLNVSRIVLQTSLPCPLKPGVKSRMKMQLEQRRQVMLQLHLSDQQFHCPRGILY